MCALSKLTEFHAAGNQLTSLPLEIGFLVKLSRLHIQKNKIKELPEGLGKLIHLEIVDVAANEIRIFPTEVSQDYSRIFCSLKICFYGNFSIFFTFQLPVYPGFLFSFSISDDSKLTLNGSMCPRMKESQYFQNPK